MEKMKIEDKRIEIYEIKEGERRDMHACYLMSMHSSDYEPLVLVIVLVCILLVS